MDVVTLGAALNGAKAQTESYVESHFTAGANITITDNADGTQTIAASGEVSSEDTVARGEIADHKADKTNPHEVDGSQVALTGYSKASSASAVAATDTTNQAIGKLEKALDGKVDTVSGKGLSSNDFTDTYKSKVDNCASTSDISDMATQTWVGQQGYLTSADEVPTVESENDGMVLTASYDDETGTYAWESMPSVNEVPAVENGDNGKILKATYSGGVGSYAWESPQSYSQVQADWNEADDSEVDYIKNKPTLGTAAAAATTDFATSAQGTKADSAIQSVKVGDSALTPDANKAVTITKSDITGLGIPAQDTTYIFEGTYNASTNKAATMSAVKDGKLTGYAQASGDVAATDKIIEAIGKVEKKADDNKNNILTVADQTTKYNICDYTRVNTAQYPDSSTGATISFDSDSLEYTINGTTNSTGTLLSNIYFDTATTKAIPNGDWVAQIYPPNIQVTLNAVATTTTTGTSLQPLVFSVTSGDTRSWVRIELGKNITFDNYKFRLMIIPKSLWDAGFTDYQPYAMSNAELTAKEQANENNISSITPYTKTVADLIAAADTYQTISGIEITLPAGKTVYVSASGYWNNGYCKGIEIYRGDTLQNSRIIGKNETETGYLALTATALYKNVSNADETIHLAAKQSSTGANTYSIFAVIS